MLLVRLIDYNLNAPNVYHFNSIFLRICLIELDASSIKEASISLNKKILSSFFLTELVVQLSAVNSAIMVLNETFIYFYKNSDSTTAQMIIKKYKKCYGRMTTM